MAHSSFHLSHDKFLSWKELSLDGTFPGYFTGADLIKKENLEDLGATLSQPAQRHIAQ